jgi:hypothetical protein
MSKITINGVELELNLMDADVVELFEELNKDIVKKIQDPNNYVDMSTADGMRFQCRLVNEYFDGLFGKGTAEKIFPHNNDLGVRMDAFGQVTALSGQVKQQMDDIKNKYRPQRVLNRAEQRQQYQGKKKQQKYNAANHS